MGPMTLKTEGWEERLYGAIQQAASKPFKWGTHDCAIWCFDTVAILRGTASPADKWRGKYRTPAGGYRVCQKLGYGTHFNVAVTEIGEPLKHLLTAQRGDLILTPQDAFGICLGSRVALLTEDKGMHYAPLHEGLFAWRV